MNRIGLFEVTNRDGEPRLQGEAKFMHLLDQWNPVLSSLGALFMERSEQPYAIAGHMMGMRPNAYDEEELLERKAQSRSFELADAMRAANKRTRAATESIEDEFEGLTVNDIYKILMMEEEHELAELLEMLRR